MVNKNEIIEQLLAENSKLTKRQATKLVESLVEIVSNKLAEGQEVKISRLGKFTVKQRADKKIYDPQAKNMRFIPAHKVIEFKESATLKKILNK